MPDVLQFRDMIIIGTKFFVWGSQLATIASRCGQCGVEAPFIMKKKMRFITIFFVIPVIPISGMSEIRQCPNCAARYES